MLSISQSALQTWDLLFLILKCDLRKNPKCPKQKRKRCFVTPPSTNLACRELATIVTKKERINFFLSLRIEQ
jgi:hypothetical protein